jgi:hypothetical protein
MQEGVMTSNWTDDDVEACDRCGTQDDDAGICEDCLYCLDCCSCDDDPAETALALAQLADVLRQSGCATLGEYLKLHPEGPPSPVEGARSCT